jgi:hypothetical protein
MNFIGIDGIVFVGVIGNQVVSSRVANGDFIGMSRQIAAEPIGQRTLFEHDMKWTWDALQSPNQGRDRSGTLLASNEFPCLGNDCHLRELAMNIQANKMFSAHSELLGSQWNDQAPGNISS